MSDPIPAEIPTPEQPAKTKLLEKSPFANLYWHTTREVYFVYAKVNGRLVRRNLNTRSVDLAKSKMDKILSDERAREFKGPAEDQTFADLVAEMERRMDARPSLKPGTHKYRRECIATIREYWPNVDVKRALDFDEQNVGLFADKIRMEYSATRYNGIIQTLRAILQVAVDQGLLLDNPANSRKRGSVKGIPTARVPLIPPQLPTMEQFDALMKAMDENCYWRKAARMIKFMAMTGARIGATRQIVPEDIDFARNTIRIPPIKYDEKPNVIPIAPELLPVLHELLDNHPGWGPLFPTKHPRKALGMACKKLGLSDLTPHDFRHLFASHAIESGADIPTVAKILGHKDGGKLMMRVYTHIGDKHAQQTMARISFKPKTKATPVTEPPAVNKGDGGITPQTQRPQPQPSHNANPPDMPSSNQGQGATRETPQGIASESGASKTDNAIPAAPQSPT